MITRIQQMRKQKPREVQALTQGHTAGRVQDSVGSPSLPDSRAQVLLQHMPHGLSAQPGRGRLPGAVSRCSCAAWMPGDAGAGGCVWGGMLRAGPRLRPGRTMAEAGHSLQALVGHRLFLLPVGPLAAVAAVGS